MTLRYTFLVTVYIQTNMSSLEEVYDGNRGCLRAVLWGTLLSVGGLLAGVGFAIVTASLVAGFGVSEALALKVAIALAGASLLVGYLVLFARTSDEAGYGSVASVGTVVAVAGLALFWLTLPSGWHGEIAALPPTAVGAYAVGLLTVLGTALAAGTADDLTRPDDGARAGAGFETDSIGGVESAVSPDRDESPTVTTHSADGGTEDDDLQFFEE